MRKFLLLLTALFAAAISMTAQTGSLIREDRVWEYSTKMDVRGQIDEYKMRFDGDTVLDGKTYNRLRTFDCVTKTFNGPGIPTVTNWGDGTTFFLREEDGKVYLHAPICPQGPFNLNLEFYWWLDDYEALLYDFNAEAGSELTVFVSSGDTMDMTVISTSETQINGENCRTYTMCATYNSHMEYTAVESIGNVSVGCIPFFVIDTISRMPSEFIDQGLCKVTDLEGNVICEKDADGLWPWEKTNGVAELEMASGLSFDGKTVSAVGEPLTVYSISGKVVAKSLGEVSTESLQPGIYVAKAGTKTLKILVK